MAKGFRKLGKASGSAIGKMTIRVFRCNGCGTEHKGKKPAQCYCGRMDFDKFDSRGEAARYANLLLQERAGIISGLVRQVKFPLMVTNLDGNKVKFADYISDFCYVVTATGEQVIEDFKGMITPEANLKLRAMEAMGLPVKVVTAKDL